LYDIRCSIPQDSGESNGTVEVLIQWKDSYTSSHKFSTPPLLPIAESKSKQPPVTLNQVEQNKSNQVANEEHKSHTHKDLQNSNDHVSPPHLSAHNSKVSVKTEDDTVKEHNSTIQHSPPETPEDSISLTPLSEDNDKTLLQQSSELLPEHLTSGDPVEINKELESSKDSHTDDTMFEEESTQSPISECYIY